MRTQKKRKSRRNAVQMEIKRKVSKARRKNEDHKNLADTSQPTFVRTNSGRGATILTNAIDGGEAIAVLHMEDSGETLIRRAESFHIEDPNLEKEEVSREHARSLVRTNSGRLGELVLEGEDCSERVGVLEFEGGFQEFRRNISFITAEPDNTGGLLEGISPNLNAEEIDARLKQLIQKAGEVAAGIPYQKVFSNPEDSRFFMEEQLDSSDDEFVVSKTHWNAHTPPGNAGFVSQRSDDEDDEMSSDVFERMSSKRTAGFVRRNSIEIERQGSLTIEMNAYSDYADPLLDLVNQDDPDFNIDPDKCSPTTLLELANKLHRQREKEEQRIREQQAEYKRRSQAEMQSQAEQKRSQVEQKQSHVKQIQSRMEKKQSQADQKQSQVEQKQSQAEQSQSRVRIDSQEKRNFGDASNQETTNFDIFDDEQEESESRIGWLGEEEFEEIFGIPMYRVKQLSRDFWKRAAKQYTKRSDR